MIIEIDYLIDFEFRIFIHFNILQIRNYLIFETVFLI